MTKAIALLLSIIGILALETDSQLCTQGSVRLLWGQGSWEGNVQICNNGIWGWVCQNTWDNLDAQVVCTQLGYAATGSVYRRSSYFGWGAVNSTIWLDYIHCTGTETSLASCSHAYDYGVTTCNFGQIAGVVCQNGGSCSAGSIRLIHPTAGTPFRGQGRVEVCYNSQWGTVCDDYWSSIDAGVACYQLGFSKTTVNSFCCAIFGQGYGPIWFDNVGCTSSNTNLFDCNKNLIGSHNCGHNEDAGARCYGQTAGSCTPGDIKLWRPYDTGPSYEGLLVYCKTGTWTGVCDDSWTCHTGRIICQQLGYPGALAYRSEGYYGYYTGGVDHYAWSCSSTHKTLSQCSYYYHSSCNAYHDQLGLVCYSPNQGSVCTEGDVRLTNGTTPSEGRVEYCYEGDWVPFCAISSATASAICTQLGFNYSLGSIFNDERFGRSNIRSSFNYKSCNSQQLFSQCGLVRKGSSCYISVAKCNKEMGLKCYNPGTCTDGQIRIVNGTIQQEGRAEVCFNGVWGSICQGSWNGIDAYVFCKELGYKGPNPTLYYNAKFGEGDGPVVWNNIACSGWESTIQSCNKQIYPSFTCSQQYTVGMTCKDVCDDGSVRLVGGGFENEGTIEVCFGNLWGLISDSGWSNGDAQVVCNQLGYGGGTATPLLGSYYGKPKMTIHLKNVACVGTENNIAQCTKTKLSLQNGKLALATTNVAGVDCIYDVPTEPPCIQRPPTYNTPGSECNNNGHIRLQGSGQTDRGRLEYCYNGYWSPFCKLDPVAASIACKQLGFLSYSKASIMSKNNFGIVRNFSLFDNITCTGSETSISQCTTASNAACTPWCPLSNIEIRCFNPGMCTDGSIRLADGIIENEGRVEVCVDGVWGTICDQGWDKTDAHVVCTQMGHPELEPVLFANSTFGDGQYPIVFSTTDCGGWEKALTNCNKQMYPDFTCSRSNIAGVLCGYDCIDGDIRLVGGNGAYEGTIEVCFDNLWGLISEVGWSQGDAEVVCRQLGYETQGTVVQYGSYYGKPNKTIHLTQVSCDGSEDRLDDCTVTTLSLQEGKSMLPLANAAGVKCYTPDACIIPPTGGVSCNHGQVRLTGGRPNTEEGNIQFCYYGTWSAFCMLGPNEATVACRQLGYTDYDLTAVFTDGRFGMTPNTSLFLNFSCSNNLASNSLSDCDLFDSCQSKCQYPLGLRCYDSANCREGDVSLVNGTSNQAGRLEVCTNGIWGSVCGTGFDVTDAYVVCKELGLGVSEPIVYTNSYFGDGDGAIVYSNFACRGYEGSVLECAKQQYGSFTCSRNNVVGIICQESCQDTDVRLVGGVSAKEGTVEVCYYNTWGLVADSRWGIEEAKVVCRQLNYNVSVATPVTGSFYGKPNRAIQLSNAGCNGTEVKLHDCDVTILSPQDGLAQFNSVNVAGVNCGTSTTTATTAVNSGASTTTAITGKSSGDEGRTSLLAALGVVVVLLIVAVLAIVGLTAVVFYKHQQVKTGRLNVHNTQVRLSDVQVDDRQGVVNPLASFSNNEDPPIVYDTTDKEELIKRLNE